MLILIIFKSIFKWTLKSLRQYFNQLENIIWKLIKDYYYPHKYWISYKFGLDKTCINIILNLVVIEIN